MKKIASWASMGLILGITLLNSCQQSAQEEAEISPADEAALSLMVTNCYSCHDPKKPEGQRIAPPMLAVKKHYMRGQPTEAEFVAAMVAFLKKPSAEAAKMPGAVERFGVMPNMSFPEQQVRDIASYIYRHDIDGPKWFEEHYRQHHGNDAPTTDSSDYQAIGQQMAISTKSQLGKNLMAALKAGGPTHAVDFCNTRAIPLTDSMATVHGASIQRVSDKPRNPDNAANAAERAHIAAFQAAITAGESPQPIVEEQADGVYFYAPILTNDMCLKCHGTPNETINAETLAMIQARYPNDKATGYAADQVRGIWRIKMNKVGQ